jgi:peroxiredoxin (alkyl hydroperoxide reductase subunit C)
MLLGKEAPDFLGVACMRDDGFEDVKLSDFRGKRYVVLIFYPMDFAFVEATELVLFSRAAKVFSDLDCALLAVSTDSQLAHKAWRAQSHAAGGIERLEIPLISDLQKEISMAYDCLSEGVATRALFVIDKNGIVQSEMRYPTAVGRSVDEVYRLVCALQRHDQTGRCTPVNWKNGEPDLVPTPEGVATICSRLPASYVPPS